jgi:hypothetical protein
MKRLYHNRPVFQTFIFLGWESTARVPFPGLNNQNDVQFVS